MARPETSEYATLIMAVRGARARGRYSGGHAIGTRPDA